MTDAKKYLVNLIKQQPDASTTDEIVRALAVDLVIRRNREAQRFADGDVLAQKPDWQRHLRRH
ncbi:MAG: hypothetical protein AAGF72_05390 [Pseudomonadota bacterium]